MTDESKTSAPMDRDEILRLVKAEMNYWERQDCTENDALAGIQIGAVGACANIIAAIATGEWMSTQLRGNQLNE